MTRTTSKLVAALALTLLAFGIPPLAARTIIADTTVIPMDRDGSLPRHDIVIDGGRILAVQPHDPDRPRPEDAVFDGRGLYAIPGLWDAHAHIASNDGPNREGDEASVHLEGPEAQAVLSRRLDSYLAWGITGVRDTGMRLDLVPLVRALEAERQRPRVVLSGPLLEGPRHRWSKDVELNLEGPEDAEAAVAMLADAEVDFLKVYGGLDPATLAAVKTAADVRGLTLAGHVPFGVATIDAVRGGLRGIEHTYVNLIKDCTEAGNAAFGSVLGAWMQNGYAGRYARFLELYDGHDREACAPLFGEMGERGTFVTITPQLDLPLRLVMDEDAMAALSPAGRDGCRNTLSAQADVPAELEARMMAALRDHYRRLIDAGVTLVAGSDAPTDCQGYGRALHKVLELHVALGLSEQEALASATINAARLARADDTGTLSPGMRADLVLLSADPLADIAATRSIAAVMRDGEFVIRR
ncbi:amidohydrolase family protein [Erythrobacter sp.]|uniref:amidohydrolase family protein n=1 Tax=Erythrobacter sp. TaxID=1042 RepID=UPI001B06F665|nr:amidohydrolase family protein [Erythrobacter sp.]MBO6525992.1 amidohydrolase family protein [Erythrobacter sp.]MBO6530659.1 amidohydrolase family protein [Erythrobacter sp.]